MLLVLRTVSLCIGASLRRARLIPAAKHTSQWFALYFEAQASLELQRITESTTLQILILLVVGARDEMRAFHVELSTLFGATKNG